MSAGRPCAGRSAAGRHPGTEGGTDSSARGAPARGRHGRLRVHGARPLPDLAGSATVLRPTAAAGDDRARRAVRRPVAARSRDARLGRRHHRLAHAPHARPRAPGRHRQPRRHARRDRDRRARRRQARAVREAAANTVAEAEAIRPPPAGRGAWGARHSLFSYRRVPRCPSPGAHRRGRIGACARSGRSTCRLARDRPRSPGDGQGRGSGALGTSRAHRDPCSSSPASHRGQRLLETFVPSVRSPVRGLAAGDPARPVPSTTRVFLPLGRAWHVRGHPFAWAQERLRLELTAPVCLRLEDQRCTSTRRPARGLRHWYLSRHPTRPWWPPCHTRYEHASPTRCDLCAHAAGQPRPSRRWRQRVRRRA